MNRSFLMFSFLSGTLVFSRVEYTKALGRFTVKELGKLTPYLRNKGSSLLRGAENRSRQLFNKNTGLCKFERRSIQPDTCPVPEG